MLWPSSDNKFSKNSTLKRHGEVLKKGHVQWNVFGGFGSGISGMSNALVAIIDTGVNNHFSYQDRLLSGVDMVSDEISGNDGDGRDMNAEDPGDYLPYDKVCDDGSTGPSSSSWHGSHVAGIVSMYDETNNYFGVSTASRILPIRVLGSCGGTLKDLLDGLLWAIGTEVEGLESNTNIPQVINMSLGAIGSCPSALQEVLNEVYQKDISVVASSGNSGLNTEEIPVYPSGCDGVISVSATNNEGELTSYSNHGGNNNVYAPGGESFYGILSTIDSGAQRPEGNTYGEMSGTSMAAPHVTAIMANLIHDFPGVSVRVLQNHLISFYQYSEAVVQYQVIKSHINGIDEEERGVKELELGSGDSGSEYSAGNSLGISTSVAGCGSISREGHFKLILSFMMNLMIYMVIRKMVKEREVAHSEPFRFCAPILGD